MDKKILESLNNLYYALEHLAKSILDGKKNKSKDPSSVTKVLSDDKLVDNLKNIYKGINDLKKSNSEIIKTQNQILSKINKPDKLEQKPKSQFFNDNDMNSVKKGIGMIALMAGSILLIGLAFKIVKEVDWKSVISLSISLPLLAIAFQRISKIEIKNWKDTAHTVLVMAGTIVLASWALALIIPISIAKGLTAILIAGVFTVVSYGLYKILNATKGVTMESLAKLPGMMFAVSFALAKSSWALQLIIPISISQGITAILIAGVFTVVSYGLAKLLNATKKENPSSFETLPSILFLTSLAIMSSSWVLNAVVPVSFSQGLTAILIAGVFTVISYGLAKLLQSTKNIKPSDLLYLPLTLVTMSAAIAASSWVLLGVAHIPFMTLLNIVVQAGVLSLIGIIMGFSMKFISKIDNKDLINGGKSLVIIAATLVIVSNLIALGNYSNNFPTIAWGIQSAFTLLAMGFVATEVGKYAPINDIIKGSLTLIALAGTIYLISQLLSNGNYNGGPTWEWAGKTALTLVIMGAAAAGIGLLMSEGLGEFVIIGAVTLVALAGSVFLISQILGAGNYGNYPSMDWIGGVGSSLIAIAISAGIIGAIMTTGVGAVFLGIGLATLLVIASSIFLVSQILGAGNYTKYPEETWIKGVSKSMTDFLNITDNIGFNITKLPLLLLVAGSIFAVSELLGNGIYNNYPKEEWNSGVSKSINSIMGIDLEEFGFIKAGKLLLISKSISEMSSIISEGNYIKYPTIEWLSGIKLSIKSFIDMKLDNYNDQKLENILNISKYINLISEVFSKGNYTKYPSLTWVDSINSTIHKFLSIKLENYSNKSFLKILELSGIISLTSVLISKGNYKIFPQDPWINGISNTIDKFSKIKATFAGVINSIGMIPIIKSIVEIDKSLREGEYKVFPSKDWIDNVKYSLDTLTPSVGDSLYGLLTGAIDFFTGNPYLRIADNLVEIDKKLSQGNFNTFPSSAWIDGVKGMSSLYEMLRGMSGDLNADKINSNIDIMSKSYDKLTGSLKNLTSTINNINLEKLNSLKLLTGSIVLMSLMDSSQFESMMDALENKAKVFVDVINQLDSSNSNFLSNSSSSSSSDVSEELKVLKSIDSKMAALVGHSQQTSANTKAIVDNHVDLRTSNKSTPGKK